MTKLVHWTLTSQSTKQDTCFELVMKRDHFNWSSSAKGKISPAVLLIRQNRHYAAKQTLPNLLANLTHRENCYEKPSASGEGRKSPLLLGGKTLGMLCRSDADRVMYNKCGRSADRSCWCGADSRHKFSVHAISRSGSWGWGRVADWRSVFWSDWCIAYAQLLYHRTSVTVSFTSLLGRVLSSIHNLLVSVKCRKQQCM